MAEEESSRARDSEGRFPEEEGPGYDEPDTEESRVIGGADETERAGDGPASAEDSKEEVDISGTSAPSIGPHTTIEYEAPETRMARSEASNVDAMGKDKRRQVVGQSYGPSVARQMTVYGIFLAVTAAFVIGFLLLAKELDKAPASNPDEAPWSQEDARQNPPLPLE
jgi:hypothetical protein